MTNFVDNGKKLSPATSFILENNQPDQGSDPLEDLDSSQDFTNINNMNDMQTKALATLTGIDPNLNFKSPQRRSSLVSITGDEINHSHNDTLSRPRAMSPTQVNLKVNLQTRHSFSHKPNGTTTNLNRTNSNTNNTHHLVGPKSNRRSGILIAPSIESVCDDSNLVKSPVNNTGLSTFGSTINGVPYNNIPVPSTNMHWRKVPGRGSRPLKPLRAHSATLVGDQIFIFGGCNSRACYNDVYIFDTDTMYWSQPEIKGDLPLPRRAHSATLTKNNKLFVFGGGNGSQYYNDLFILDTVTLTWSEPATIGDPPSPRRAHAACYYKDALYIIGGGDGLYPLNDIYKLDLASSEGYRWHKLDTISTSDKLPPPRGYHTANLVNNQLVVFGGSDGADCFDDIHVLDLDTLQWISTTASPSLPRLAHTSTLVGPYLYVIGGRNNRSYSADMQILHLREFNDAKWETKKVYGTPPTPRGYHTSTVHDARLFLFGGYDGIKFFNDMYVLDLASSAYLTQLDPPRIVCLNLPKNGQ